MPSIHNPWQRVFRSLSAGVQHLLDSHVLYALSGVMVLLILWGGTEQIIATDRRNAEAAAQSLAVELSETYEAQVIRVMREIDQYLRLVQFASDEDGPNQALVSLGVRQLLPPDFLFTVSLYDVQGHLLATTDKRGGEDIASDFVAEQQADPGLRVAPVAAGVSARDLRLQFSRRLSTVAGEFAGVILISVDAGFFVSSYEVHKLGVEGEMGLLGLDGQFRIRRVGDTLSAGDQVDFPLFMAAIDTMQTSPVLTTSPIDGVERYMSARGLFNFPLAVVVSLSKSEQLQATAQMARVYRWRAFGLSLVLIAIISILWRLQSKLVASRRHEVEVQMAHARQVEYLAYHDGLTGLPNRSLFSKLLGQSLALSQREGRTLAVMFLDLDHFKQINDTLGHDAGDELLKEVARRLQSSLRASDTVARLGGDEFVVILPDIAARDYALTVASKIIAAVARPYLLSGQEFRVTASIGISTFPDGGLDEQTLTKNADIAMYKAKEEGKNNYQLYSDALHSESLDRLALESSLRHALERHELTLLYQPKLDMNSERVTGMEALLRWQHPDLGTVAPLRFLQVAEDIGLLIPIGRWVLNTVCAQNMAWQKQGLAPMTMAVNLNSRQFFHVNLAQDISEALTRSGMAAGLLELEVSESVLLHDPDKSLKVFNQLKALGVRIAIDNFGVGYSSLSMLKKFPLDVIKIDRSFIRNIADTDDDKTLAEAIVNMGRTLGMTVVAQGVETEQQADFLREHACNEAQGFYFTVPQTADELLPVLRQQERRASQMC